MVNEAVRALQSLGWSSHISATAGHPSVFVRPSGFTPEGILADAQQIDFDDQFLIPLRKIKIRLGEMIEALRAALIAA